LGENFPRIKKKVVPYISGVKRWNKNLWKYFGVRNPAD
jgi:hypothetical protein